MCGRTATLLEVGQLGGLAVGQSVVWLQILPLGLYVDAYRLMEAVDTTEGDWLVGWLVYIDSCFSEIIE